ncbi:MAG: hypothetical protein PHX78_08820 [bacterium]|nr:hypothetical protein [bacterium]
MAICCGKIDKTMQAGKIKSLVYLFLFMGYLGTVTVFIAIWSLFKSDLNTTKKILVSFWLIFLLESSRLTLLPAEIKSRFAGKIFRFSPRVSGYFFKYFDSFLIISILSALSLIIYAIIAFI